MHFSQHQQYSLRGRSRTRNGEKGGGAARDARGHKLGQGGGTGGVEGALGKRWPGVRRAERPIRVVAPVDAVPTWASPGAPCPVASRAPAASPPGGTSDFYSATRPDGRGDRLAASKHRRVRDAIESRGQCGSGEQFASRGLSRLVHSEIKRDRIVACSVRRRMLAIHGNCWSIELVSFWTVAVMEDEITRTGHT